MGVWGPPLAQPSAVWKQYASFCQPFDGNSCFPNQTSPHLFGHLKSTTYILTHPIHTRLTPPLLPIRWVNACAGRMQLFLQPWRRAALVGKWELHLTRQNRAQEGEERGMWVWPVARQLRATWSVSMHAYIRRGIFLVNLKETEWK